MTVLKKLYQIFDRYSIIACFSYNYLLQSIEIWELPGRAQVH